MYIIYSKTKNDCVITFYDLFNTLDEAKNKMSECARNYIHNCNESGYKMRDADESIIISKDEQSTVVGYIWSSIVIKKVDVLSFHIAQQVDSTTQKVSIPEKNDTKQQTPTFLILNKELMDELKIKLKKRRNVILE